MSAPSVPSGAPSGTEPSLTIEAVDPVDGAAVAAWYGAYLAGCTHGRPFATPWRLPEILGQVQAPAVGERITLHAGRVGDEVVAAGFFELPLLDNTEIAYATVYVSPEHRGRGHGTALMQHLLDLTRAEGRSVVTSEAAYPFDWAPDGAGHPDVEFLRRLGFRLALVDVQRELDLPVDEALLEALAAEAAPHHKGYELRQWVGPVPEELLETYGELIGSLVVEAPMGELELEPELYPPERIRADEAMVATTGRTRYTTVFLSTEGRCVAYSELIVPAHDPGRVFQWGTLVHRDHRGHRLGLATKALNLRFLQRERTDAVRLTTWNAEVNTHMIGVNDRLGFRPVERSGEFQRRLADPPERG